MSRRARSRRISRCIESLEPRQLLSAVHETDLLAQSLPQPIQVLDAEPGPVTDYDFGTVSGTVSEIFYLDPASPQGLYSFVLPDVGTADSAVSIAPTDAALSDLDLVLLGSDSGVVGTSQAPGSNETISLAGRPAGYYYVIVYDAEYGAAEYPEFRLTITGAGSADDSYEENDTIEAATALGDRQGASSLPDLVLRDDDWFTFNTVLNGVDGNYIAIDYDATAADLYLGLAAIISGEPRVWSASPTDTGLAISMSGLPAGTYYVMVSSLDGPASADYTLTIDAPSLADDDFEPNNTAEDATDLGLLLGEHVYDDLAQFDDDVYRFEIPAEGNRGNFVRIDFLQAAGDLDITLISESSSLTLASNGVDDYEQISLSGLPAGVYYLFVKSYPAGAANPYYQLTINAPLTAIPLGFSEPDDNFEEAWGLGSVSGKVSLASNTIHEPGDEDYFRFTTVAAANESSYLEINFVSADGDLDLYLYDPDGNQLGSSNGYSDSERISLDGLPVGTYYFRVLGYADAVNSYTATLVLPTAAALPADSAEPNNSFAAAFDLRELSGPFRRDNLTIHAEDDEDFFRFKIARGTTANFLSIAFTHADGDLDVVLYDAQQNSIRSSAGVGDTETVALDLPAGIYVLKVSGYAGSANRYSLSINAPLQQPVAPDSREASEPIRLTQNTTIAGLSIHNPAVNDNRGTRADRFALTTTGVGGPTDYARITFSRAQGPLQLQLLDAAGEIIETSDYDTDEQTVSLANLPAGAYTLVVDSLTGSTNPAYDLTLNANFTTELPLWTVLVYMSGDNNLEPAAIADINEMEASALARNLQLAVLLDRAPGYDTSNGDWTDTRRAIIRPDNNPGLISSTFESVGEVDMSQPQSLTSFINWGVSTLPARNYALIMWDHGAAFSGSQVDETSGDTLLSLSGLDVALAAASTHISVLGFDACMMATVETIGAIGDRVDYLVASEEAEGNSGWDYTVLLQDLLALEELDPRGLASTIVQAARENRAISTLSAMKGIGNRAMATLKAFVNVTLNRATAADRRAILAARRAAPSYYYKYLRDLKGFMTEVRARTVNADIRQAAGNVIDALNESVANNHSVARAGGGGLTIYLPGPEDELAPDYANTDFARETGWVDLLNALRSETEDNQLTRDWAESNNVRANATDLQRLSAHNIRFDQLTIDTPEDVDWFRFSTAATAGAADQVQLLFEDAAGRLAFTLYDAAGAPIASSAQGDPAPTVSLAGRPAGDFSIRVSGVSGAINSYTLVIDTPPVVEDWAENNNSLAKAHTLPLNQPNNGLTLSAVDSDWYSFGALRVPAANPLILTADFPAGATLTLGLYDASEHLIAQSTSTSGTATLNYPDFDRNKLYLRVSGSAAENGQLVSYSLDARHDASVVITPPIPNLSVSDVTLTETNKGTRNAVFNVSMSVTSAEPVTVSYATANGTARAGLDYTAVSGTLTFAPGEKTKTVAVPVIGELVRERTETFLLNLSSPVGGALLDARGVGTILDTDLPEIRVYRLAGTKKIDVLDNQGAAVSFGKVLRGRPAPVVSFLVYNTGTANLNLGKLVLPKGFAIVDPLVRILAPGKSDRFSLQMPTTLVATRNGMLQFNNDDPNESPYNFKLAGQVTAPRAARAQVAAPADLSIARSPQFPFAAVRRIVDTLF